VVFGLVTFLTGACVSEPGPSGGEESLTPAPPPPTEPVTPGYIQSYYHRLGYSFEYPEDWEMHSPEEVTPGGGIEKVEMFTKKEGAASITVIVKSTDWENLEEVKKQYGEIDPLKITLKEDITEVNGREGYEIIYKHPSMKTREVVFLANGKAYTIKYSCISWVAPVRLIKSLYASRVSANPGGTRSPNASIEGASLQWVRIFATVKNCTPFLVT